MFLSEPACLQQYPAELLQILAQGCGGWVDGLQLRVRAVGGSLWITLSSRPGASPDVFSGAHPINQQINP